MSFFRLLIISSFIVVTDSSMSCLFPSSIVLTLLSRSSKRFSFDFLRSFNVLVMFSNDGNVALQLVQDHMNWTISPAVYNYKVLHLFLHILNSTSIYSQNMQYSL